MVEDPAASATTTMVGLKSATPAAYSTPPKVMVHSTEHLIRNKNCFRLDFSFEDGCILHHSTLHYTTLHCSLIQSNDTRIYCFLENKPQPAFLLVVLLIGVPYCTRTEQRLQQHRAAHNSIRGDLIWCQGEQALPHQQGRRRRKKKNTAGNPFTSTTLDGKVMFVIY